MIKRIIRKSYFPIQTIFDALRRRRNVKKMMNFYLGIKAKHLAVGYKNEGVSSNGK